MLKKLNEQYHYEEDLVEQMATGKAQDRNNEKHPYNVPTTIEPEWRPKKEPEKKHQQKYQPLQVLKRREPSKTTAGWTKASNETEHPEQMKSKT